MLAIVEITSWHWTGFVIAILILLGIDLGFFHRRAHEVRYREAFRWTGIWFLLSMGFAAALVPARGREEAAEFLTGYIIELSLSMDNVFVMALIFAYFRVPSRYQHRVLFYGIAGALLMRGVMIGLGAALIQRFHWMLYVLGAFLVLTGIKVLFAEEAGVQPEKNWVIRMTRRFFKVTSHFDGQRFFTTESGRQVLTPLALVLLMIETTDLVFAVDSIPAIFAVTTKPFIVFSSNVFAILGLRSLYFVLAGAIQYFRYLKVGLSIILVCIGIKMLLAMFDIVIPTETALLVVATIILISILCSIVTERNERERGKRGRGE